MEEKEFCGHTSINTEMASAASSSKGPDVPKSISIATTVSIMSENNFPVSVKTSNIPLVVINATPSIVIHSPNPSQVPQTSKQTREATTVIRTSAAPPYQPDSLFVLALTKLNESSISIAGNSKIRNAVNLQLPLELTPPESLISAPPSYSFVLRQIAAKRRPRFMGKILISPSFIPHTPPPDYAAAFDMYVDNIPTPPPRVYHFGFASMPIVCPECGFNGMSVTVSKVTICTHLCAATLCLFCCWICVPLPYVMRSCKDVYHYCRSCRSLIGMYCPTNLENTMR